MDDAGTGGLSNELLKDFYAECEEHFGSIRQALVALEGDQELAEATSLTERIYRSFHSLKGMFGIAGIESAEILTHQAEDYLRDLSRGHGSPGPEGLDLLASSVQLLEAAVTAHRDRRPLPDIQGLRTRFDTHLAARSNATPSHAGTAAPVTGTVEQNIEQARQKGRFVWKATFTPSSELNSRGVNVGDIRTRLADIGEILHAAPQVGSQGSIAFEFFVSVPGPRPAFGTLENDAVRFEQVATPAAHDPSGAAPPQSPKISGPSQVIRVELNRLDDLMRITGELVLQRARLEEQIEQLAAMGIDVRKLHEMHLGLARHLRDLRSTVMRLRMVPIAEIFDRMPFVVRDLNRGSPRKVRLETHGQSTELDKHLVERLKEPLLHLVRNALSHGIEAPDERIAAGKPPEAVLKLSASTAGESVVIEVSDDGRGIDPARILPRAAEMDIPIPENLTPGALIEILSTPGFSTREQADRASGRGVGMSVVSGVIRELGGSLALETQLSQGTRFTIRLPLTLLITDALIVSSGGRLFAVPQNSVQQVTELQESEVRRMGNAEMVPHRGAALPLTRITDLFALPRKAGRRLHILVTHTSRGPAGVVVDRVLGQQQIVVRSAHDPLLQVPGVIGATELGDGRPLLILDPVTLANECRTARGPEPHDFGDNKHNTGNNDARASYRLVHSF